MEEKKKKKEISKYLSQIGRKGGLSKSEKKKKDPEEMRRIAKLRWEKKDKEE